MKGTRFGQLPSIESARAIESGAYSPDGSMIALGEYDGDVEVIDTINWNRKYLLSGHSRNTTSLAFSPDSRRLVSGGHDAELRLWDLTKGECLFVMEEHENWVNEVRFSPCGKKIASASHDYTVRIWDTDTGRRLHVLEGHTHYVLSIDFSPNGRRLGSGSEDGTLRFWDVETGDAEAVADDYEPVYKFAWSPNGEWMAMSGYDKAEIRDCHHLGLLAVLEGHVGKILNLAYSPNGELLVTAGEDHTVRVWDAATGTQVSLFTDHGGYVNFCKFSSDGQRIASGGDDRRLRLWDVFGSGTPTTGAGYFGHLSCVNKVNYTPDGKSLFSCSGIGEVRNWVASTGAAGPVRIEGIANLLATAISPDGMIFAGGGRDRDDSTIIQLWDCRTGATLRALEGHDAFIYDLAFSPCGRYMASASVDQTAYLWDLQDKDSKPHTLVKLDQNNSDCPRFVAFSPMADKLAIGFRNSAIHLYNHRTKHFLKTFQGDRFSLGSMAFSPCGRQMVLGTSINSLYLWDLESKTHNAKLDGLENWPLTVAYSPCGCWIASGGQDRRVSLWKKESDSEQQSISWSLAHVITSFSGTVSTLAWNPQDEFEFATGCNDKSVRIWTVKHDKETKRTDVYLKWGSEFGELVAMDAIVSGAEDLNVTNRMVLVERGAFGSTIVENSLSCTSEE
ncbi:WD40-repeat-containing domain protein [Linnemannia elongata]|nr:WD40-repeat-containing domain protein [Linnemannia elongata]